MGECLFDPFHLKGHGMEFGGLLFRANELAGIDGKCLADPFHIGAG
jgi:hypothetical protein